MMVLLDEQPRRMVREKRELEELAQKLPGFSPGAWSAQSNGSLVFSFRLCVWNFDGQLVYPSLFPDVPAFIKPQDGEMCWSGHQYMDGTLCLERGPDNWDANVTGADLIRSADKLLWNEGLHVMLPHIDAAPSRHRLTQGQALRGEHRRFLLTGEFAEHVRGLAESAACELQMVTAALEGYEVTAASAAGITTFRVLPGTPSESAHSRGWLFVVNQLSHSTVQSVSDLVAMVTPGGGISASDLNSCTVLLQELVSGDFRALHVSETGEVTELTLLDGRQRDNLRVPPEYAILSTKTVMVVGTGSLGSKIVASLARSGVRRFFILDTDVLLPQNLVRNELDVRHLGFSKVDAVAARIKEIAPDAEVAAVSVEIGSQENPLVAARMADVIRMTDLVLDATANPDAFLTLAAVCKRTGAPMVWGEMFAGGGGALMARSRPKQDADPLAVRTHIYGVLESMPAVPRGQSTRYALQSEDEVMVAGDAEVSHLAAVMTSFAIDALCREDSEYPVSAYLLGFKKFWEFQAPFDTIPVACPPATETVAQPELNADEKAVLEELMLDVQRSANAASEPATQRS